MKHTPFSAVVAALAIAASTVALAQTAPSGTPSGPGGSAGPAARGGEGLQRFEEHKQNLLAHIAERLAKMQQFQSCVQAATNREQLRACRPAGPEHPPGE